MPTPRSASRTPVWPAKAAKKASGASQSPRSAGLRSCFMAISQAEMGETSTASSRRAASITASLPAWIGAPLASQRMAQVSRTTAPS